MTKDVISSRSCHKPYQDTISLTISRIEKCTTNATSSSSPTAFLECCPMIQEEIETERECFCSIRNRIRDKPTALNALTRLFTVCSLPGSFDSVCP
ncbi:Target of Myb protein 1, partial [Bienertia sinuspersici]